MRGGGSSEEYQSHSGRCGGREGALSWNIVIHIHICVFFAFRMCNFNLCLFVLFLTICFHFLCLFSIMTLNAKA